MQDAGEPTGLSASLIRAHVSRLNAEDMAGRRTATLGYAAAADYVAGRLRASGVQPVHPGEYRHLTYDAVNHASGVLLRSLGPDSTVWDTDRDLLPDPRTASVSMRAASVRRIPGSGRISAALPSQIAIVDSVLSTGRAIDLAAAGFEAVLIQRHPTSGRASMQLPLAAIQVAPDRLSRILDRIGRVPEGLERLEIRVEADHDSGAGFIHVVGMLAGWHPASRDRAVLVAAQLDSGGFLAGVAMPDPGRSGLEAAALLEVARVMAAERQRGAGNARTVVFAWFAGGAQGDAGLRSFLRHPPWPLDAVDAVILAGAFDEVAGLEGVRRLVAPDIAMRPTPDAWGRAGLELADRIQREVEVAARSSEEKTLIAPR
ncbi:MAG: M28 family peptidase [Rhodothermales bacterium]|nr:M28 family peptidase [Rhodothermales bacterium]